MEDETTVSAPYVFRGIEYIVTMSVQGSNNLMVEVEDKLTADQWRADFDTAYVEDLTHKTGNFKQFNIFVSMLESAVIQASDSVSLDLLTYSDLESLRQRKSGSSARTAIPQQRTVTLNSKRYLILTYTVEFDRIHYPLPLPYVGKPDPRALQEQIRLLRAELKALKQGTHGTSETKHKEVEKLRKELEALRKEKEDMESEYLQFRREVKNTTQGNALKELKMFKTMTRGLEEELMKEKTKHQRVASKHGQQYRDLLEELEEIRASERNLRIRVKSLTNELALYKRDKNRPSRQYSRERTNSYDRYSSSRERSRDRERSLSRDRERSLSRERSLTDRLSARDRSRDRDRNSSANNRSRLSDKPNHFKNSFTHRSRTPSPSGGRNSRFDPSAYIKEKERKKKEAVLKKQRQQRANISGSSMSSKPSSGPRLSNSRRSAGSRNRSRTSSFGSQGDMSDGNMTDSSYTSLGISRNYNRNNQRGRSRKVNNSGASSSYLSSPDIPKKTESKIKRNNKILASTPENAYHKTKSVRNKENIPNNGDDSDYFDRSAEISEIDERLNRLQLLMKTSLS